MIFGIGTDIVSIARIESTLQRYGDRFARRILAADEFAGFSRSVRPAHYLAKRFAAKEATVKAFGTGMREGLGFHQISIGHSEHGRPRLRYNGCAADFCQQRGITASHISIADEQDYAIAFVTLLST